MLGLKVVPEIYCFDTFADFNKAIPLTEKDLIVTNKWIYDPYIKPLGTKANVIYQEKYGAGEPSDVMIDAIIKDAKQFNYDRIIAVGGGTVIDISKVLSLKVPDKSVKLFTGEAPIIKEKELITIPTTCGTGSEVTNVAVVALTSLHTKKGIASDETYAAKAVLIPESLDGLPDKVFATSSIDALIHAVESYLSPTMLFSVEAIDMILGAYKKVVANGGGKEARRAYLKEFCFASTYAGIAFGNAGCGPVHAMSYAPGGEFHIAHGESNYVLFTDVLKKYQEKAPNGERLQKLNKRIADLLDCDVADVYKVLDDLLGKLIEKKPLHAYGMAEAQIDTFTELTIASQQRLMSNQYIELTRQDIAAIYRAAF